MPKVAFVLFTGEPLAPPPSGKDHCKLLPVAVKVIVLPTHTGLLLEADGAPGVALIVTLVLPAGDVHPLADKVTK